MKYEEGDGDEGYQNERKIFFFYFILNREKSHPSSQGRAGQLKTRSTADSRRRRRANM